MSHLSTLLNPELPMYPSQESHGAPSGSAPSSFALGAATWTQRDHGQQQQPPPPPPELPVSYQNPAGNYYNHSLPSPSGHAQAGVQHQQFYQHWSQQEAQHTPNTEYPQHGTYALNEAFPSAYSVSPADHNHDHESYSHPGHQTTERASLRLVARETALGSPQDYRQRSPYSPQAQPPKPANKRPVTDDGERTGKPKKAKTTRVKAVPSKNGFSPKKRTSEAPPGITMIAGAVTYQQDGVTPVSLNEGPYPHELQTARCMAAKYKTDVVARCVSCTRRWSGDTCRFQNIRYLFRDEKSSIKGVGFVEVESPDTSLTYPTTWNVPLTDEHILRIKSVVAASLLSPLLEERKHMTCKQIVRRTRESEVRVTCDTCMTSIFSGSWICRQCGRECCPECVERIRSLTTVGPNATDEEKVAHKKRLEEHKYMNPNFLACSGGNHSHRMSEFSPMSRFCKAELEQAITEMQALIGGGGARDEPNRDHWDENSPGSPLTPVSSRPSSRNGHHTHTIEPEIARALAFGPLLDRVGIPYHETIRYTHQEFDEAKFQTIWRAGVPVIVTGLAEKFSIQWTPQYFIETYGDQEVRVLKCQPKEKANSMERWTVGKFFESYGKYQDRDDAWKIKDWPPTADFKSTFPELFKDFSNVVPVPNYVRRDGVLNIASHFPSSAIPPDIGPKMYNAMASYENGDSQGSTRLHMDMADAVNIMTFASKCPDGSPGCAAWDLYRAEDSDKIRGFLRREFPPKTPADPIHSQEHYLNTERRQKLFDETGVKSHRIYQTPGQAVFIPAGCAHQVCNLADCIKVAVDFVSPENVHRCENLTREFREQNRAAVWKEDVLQLRTMMWFAWLSCSLQTVSRTAIASA